MAEPLFKGVVQDTGGGHVIIWVERDTESYPGLGAHVYVYSE